MRALMMMGYGTGAVLVLSFAIAACGSTTSNGQDATPNTTSDAATTDGTCPSLELRSSLIGKSCTGDTSCSLCPSNVACCRQVLTCLGDTWASLETGPCGPAESETTEDDAGANDADDASDQCPALEDREALVGTACTATAPTCSLCSSNVSCCRQFLACIGSEWKTIEAGPCK